MAQITRNRRFRMGYAVARRSSINRKRQKKIFFFCALYYKAVANFWRYREHAWMRWQFWRNFWILIARKWKKFQLFEKFAVTCSHLQSPTTAISFLICRAWTVRQNTTKPNINLIAKAWRINFLISKIRCSIVGPPISHIGRSSVIDIFDV